MSKKGNSKSRRVGHAWQTIPHRNWNQRLGDCLFCPLASMSGMINLFFVKFYFKLSKKDNSLRMFTKSLQRISEDAGMPIRSGPVFCKYAQGQLNKKWRILSFYLNIKVRIKSSQCSSIWWIRSKTCSWLWSCCPVKRQFTPKWSALATRVLVCSISGSTASNV